MALGRCFADAPGRLAKSRSNQIDDTIGLLLMERKAWLREVPEVARLVLLRDGLDAMARQPHTVDLMLDLGEKLEAAGVDLKAGF